MSKKLKGLGLALVAVLACSGIVALAVQAETPVVSELSASLETTLDVTDTGTAHGKLARLTFGNGARYIECTQAKQLTGSIVGSASTVTATPTYEACFSNGLTNASATVKHNGCTLTLTATKTNTGEATLDCPEGKQIEVHIFENAKADTENKPICTYDVKPQTIAGATISTGGAAGPTHDLTINLNTLSKLKVLNTGPGGIAVCGITAGKEAEGAFAGNLTVTGTFINQQVGVALE